MNHVFNKLANDAWIDVPEGQGYCGKIFSKEKFAELIIKECMAVAVEYQNVGGNCYVDNMIAKHFGVKK